MALTTIDIDSRLKKYSQFKGVYPLDKLPFEILAKPFGMVINLDPSWKTGSHWTAIYIPEYGPGLYFDSFGNRPLDLITSFLERNCKFNGFKYNHYIYQGDLSIKCGLYCILFLESCFENKDLPLIKCNSEINEFIIKNIY